MAETQTGEQKSWWRRGAEVLKKIHYAIGAVAVGAAVLFNSAPAAIFGAYEFGHGFVVGKIGEIGQKKPVVQPSG